MPRLSAYGHIFDVPADALATWVVGIILSPFDAMGGLYWGLYFGMPSRTVKQFLAVLDVSAIQENILVLDDDRLVGLLKLILSSIVQFTDRARQLLQWEQAHVPSKVRKAHVIVSREHGPRQPPWAAEREYRKILSSSADAFHSYLDALEQAEPIMRALLPGTADPPYAAQFDRTFRKVPDVRQILDLGFEEVIRQKSSLDWSNPPAG